MAAAGSPARARSLPHPGSLAQLIAFHAGRIAGDAVKGGT